MRDSVIVGVNKCKRVLKTGVLKLKNGRLPTFQAARAEGAVVKMLAAMQNIAAKKAYCAEKCLSLFTHCFL